MVEGGVDDMMMVGRDVVDTRSRNNDTRQHPTDHQTRSRKRKKSSDKEASKK
jgi:hypothetical protein